MCIITNRFVGLLPATLAGDSETQRSSDRIGSAIVFVGWVDQPTELAKAIVFVVLVGWVKRVCRNMCIITNRSVR